MKASLGPCLLLLIAANVALGQQPREEVAKELASYYEKGEAPPWTENIKNLTAENAEQRTKAANYLVALLDQA
jgi:hypothetical protein